MEGDVEDAAREALCAVAMAERRRVHSPARPARAYWRRVELQPHHARLALALADALDLPAGVLASEILERALDAYATGRDRLGRPLDWSAPTREAIAEETRALRAASAQLTHLVAQLDATTRTQHCPECGATWQTVSGRPSPHA